MQSTREFFSKRQSAASRKIRFFRDNGRFAANAIRNTKYNVLTFVPLVLYNQFRFFFNLFFLAVALSQFIPGAPTVFAVHFFFGVRDLEKKIALVQF